MLQYVTPETLTLEYLFYGFNIWQRTFYGLYRARRRCGRGRFASLIPVGLAPDIPFTNDCPKQTVPRKRFMQYNLTRASHSVPDKTIERNKIFCPD